MTFGQTGRSPSIPKKVSYSEPPVWTSPSVVRFYFRNSQDCNTRPKWNPALYQAAPQLNSLWVDMLNGLLLCSPNTVLQDIIDQHSYLWCLYEFPPHLPFCPSYWKRDFFFQKWRGWIKSLFLNALKILAPLPLELGRLLVTIKAALICWVTGPFNSPAPPHPRSGFVWLFSHY